jgi:hypothetical protein
MTRKNAVSILMATVLVLTLLFAASTAIGAISIATLHADHTNPGSPSAGWIVPALSGALADDCGGCSGGGGG